jgi:hypothetical protein
MNGIIENQEAVEQVFFQYFGDPEADRKEKTEPQADAETGEGLADAVIIDKAKAAKNGNKFSELWEGGLSDLPSQSEADLALCQMLAFWTNKNAEQMDRIFRDSGLFREKWDVRHGRDTYGALTIQKAIDRTTETFTPRTGKADPQADYFQNETGTYFRKPTKEGPVSVQLANFSATINSETVRDDGQTKTIFFGIIAKLRGREFSFPLPVNKFSAMNWPTEEMGAGAIVEPGPTNKDRLRVAFQTLSGDVPRHEVYIHTGWKKFSSDWAYLHADGALGADGALTGIETDLGPLQNYSLPDPPEDAGQVTKDALNFFKSLPCGLRWPLFLSPFRAILAEVDTPENSLYLVGPTGGFKSELAAILQSFFGVTMADKRNLPASWASTSNANERMAFLAKDAILCIDDFAPNGTQADISRLHRDGERILRGAGNHSGRGRMNADGSLRTVNFPRGAIVVTGEDLPSGQSLRSRLFVSELKPWDVSGEQLTKGQTLAANGTFNQLAAAFITWTASRLDELKKQFPQRKIEVRETLNMNGHARTASLVADFLTLAEVFRLYAQDVEAMTEQDAADWLEQVKNELLTQAEGQAEHLAAEDPTRRFFALLATCFISNRGHLRDASTNGEPPEPGRWGWEDNGRNEIGRHFSPRGDPLGWVDAGNLYLDPEAAFAAVQRLGREQGTGLPISQGRLWKTLKGKGLLLSYEPGRNLAKVTIDGSRRRAVHLHAEQIFQVAGPSLVDFPPEEQSPRENEWVDL